MDKQIEKFEFRVIDKNTGEEADIEEIAFTEDWAKGLIYCDMEGFAILEDGSLVLLDECGNCAYCPSGRFSIIPECAVVLTPAERDEEMRLIREDVIERMEATRKETAERIAHAIENLLKERFIGLTLRQHLQRKGMEEGLKMALEIAKEITEGV